MSARSTTRRFSSRRWCCSRRAHKAGIMSIPPCRACRTCAPDRARGRCHRRRERRRLERRVRLRALLPARALPDDARIALQRHQPLARIGPVLPLIDADVIDRLAAGAALEQRARNVDHVARARALVKERRAAARAEAALGPGLLVLVARDLLLAGGHAVALAP